MDGWMDGTQGNRKRSVGSRFHPRSEDAAAAQVARWTSPLHAPLPHFVYTVMSIGEATIRAYAIISARVCARDSIFNPCPPSTWPQVNSRSLRKHDFKNPSPRESIACHSREGRDRILNNNAILLSYSFSPFFFFFSFRWITIDRWNQWRATAQGINLLVSKAVFEKTLIFVWKKKNGRNIKFYF